MESIDILVGYSLLAVVLSCLLLSSCILRATGPRGLPLNSEGDLPHDFSPVMRVACHLYGGSGVLLWVALFGAGGEVSVKSGLYVLSALLALGAWAFGLLKKDIKTTVLLSPVSLILLYTSILM